MLEIGSIVDGKYKILNQIGKGGMSVVYLAINEAANKPWAIKEVRKDGTKDFEVVRQGLIVETDMLKRLNHPNLPSIVDVIDRDDTFLIVMDYIEGKSLSSVIKENGAQPQEYVIEWAKQLCDVLGYLHSRRPPIIYRDMKPSNVMLKPDGNVTLIDFGTAREYKNKSMVEDTTCLGTQGYAAPEQFGGHGQTDGRTDIYNLGATIYHLVTGHNPAKPPYEMYPIRQWNPHLSSGLEQIILKCTKRDPEARYQTCSELMYALEHYNEMDYAYQKTQKLKFWSFAATLALSIGLFTTAGIMHHKEKAYAAQSYDSYYKNAEMASDVDDFVENIEHALDLDATNPDAYELILKKFKVFEDEDESGLITYSEYGKIKEIVTKKSEKSDIRRIDDFENNQLEKYYIFCYKFGTEIWLGVNNGENIAKTWLEKVKNPPEKNLNIDKEYENAQILIKLSEYSSESFNMFDSEIDYVQFWEDLESVYKNASDDRAFSTPQTQLYAYKKILSIITDNKNMTGFYRKIKLDTVNQMIDNIEKQITDSSKYSPNDDSYATTYNSIITQIPLAREKVEAVYNKNGEIQDIPVDDTSGGDPE